MSEQIKHSSDACLAAFKAQLEASRASIAAGGGVIADDAYFARLKRRALLRLSPEGATDKEATDQG